MDLEIIAIHKQGKADEEYVILKANQDVNLKNYALCDTTYLTENTISNELRHFYWFIPTDVRAGEFVILFTRHGKYSKTKDNNNNVMHNFFWNSGKAIWNDAGDAAVLFNLRTWRVTKAK